MNRLNSVSRTILLMLLASVTAMVSATAMADAHEKECNAAEVGYVATFNVKPGSEAAFEAALSNLARTVRKMEPGAVLYAPFRGAEGRYYMMERYVDEAARKVHGTSTEVQALFPALGPHLAGAPDVQPVSAICP
ncbi:MAG: putative quinol monooxygenase [Pseudomonadales bacterium]|nr:antibiotic biosynthesis monooxygenase [Pseudomonadales bacterium]